MTGVKLLAKQFNLSGLAPGLPSGCNHPCCARPIETLRNDWAKLALLLFRWICSLTTHYQSLNDNFNIYPNPTNGVFTITNEKNNPYDIIIYDVVGKLVYEKQHETNKEIKLDLSAIGKGIYFVTIISDNQRIVKRLVIK